MHNDVFENYVNIYITYGKDMLFKRAIGNGILISSQVAYPEIILLDHSEEFFSLFRKTGDNKYFEIGKILRRAAHKIYREFSRIYKNNDLNYPINGKFLNIIK